jgi:hypothetical protein
MPEISRFFGIVIAIYYSDHEPAHFHARYGSQRARFAIEDLRLLDGDLSPRARGLAIEWASQHQAELRANWARAGRHEPLESIAGLE